MSACTPSRIDYVATYAETIGEDCPLPEPGHAGALLVSNGVAYPTIPGAWVCWEMELTPAGWLAPCVDSDNPDTHYDYAFDHGFHRGELAIGDPASCVYLYDLDATPTY